MRWFAKLLSDDESAVSFGHVTCACVILYIMAASAITIYETRRLPDIPAGWNYVIGVLWGAQKAADAFASRKEAPKI